MVSIPVSRPVSTPKCHTLVPGWFFGVFMVPGRFSWFQIGFSWFQVGFHGFSWFQIGFSWFQVGFSWFQVVFHVFMAYSGVQVYFYRHYWSQVGVNPSRAPQARSETLRTPKMFSLHLYLGPTIPLGLASRRPALA